MEGGAAMKWKIKSADSSKYKGERRCFRLTLNNRVLLYSLLLIAVITGAFFLYSFIMLPRVYEYQMNKEIDSELKKMHKELVRDGRFTTGSLISPHSVFHIQMTEGKSDIRIIYFLGSIDLSFSDPQWSSQISRLTSDIGAMEEMDKEQAQKVLKEDIEGISHLFAASGLLPDTNEKVKITYRSSAEAENDQKDIDNTQYGSSYDYTRDGIVLLTNWMKDNRQIYENKISFSKDGEKMYMTYTPVMIGGVYQLLPALYTGIPMILCFLVILFIGISFLFTRGITAPIKKLADETGQLRFDGADNLSLQAAGTETDTAASVRAMCESGRNDEIGELSREIASLYKRLAGQYKEMEDQNRRKEFLLRGTAHQLKTPLSGALMLVRAVQDHVIGPQQYEQTMDKLKERLGHIQSVIERFLWTEQSFSETDTTDVQIRTLIGQCLTFHREEHEMEVSVKGDCTWRVNPALAEIVFDNIVSNCFCHTDRPGSLEIVCDGNKVTFYNEKAHIPGELMTTITEPFVSTSGKKGHGLGLYLASDAAAKAGLTLTIENRGEGVLTTIRKGEGENDNI